MAGALPSAAESGQRARCDTRRQNTALVLDAVTHRETMVLKGHAATVLSVAFSPDGKRIVTGSEDATARIWNAETGAEIAVLRGHNGGLSASFSPDGKRILTAGLDGTARIWDAATGEQTVLLQHNKSVNSAAFNHDGTRVVTGDDGGNATVWDAR